MEGDQFLRFQQFSIFYFNPLPPYGGRPSLIFMISSFPHFNPLPPYGGRQHRKLVMIWRTEFQSTPSVWRETPSIIQMSSTSGNFNPLPPYGGRRPPNCSIFSDPVFQSTPSVWRETYARDFTDWIRSISIHSLRMEGDSPIPVRCSHS